MLTARGFDLVGNTTLAWLNLLWAQVDHKDSGVYDIAK
jgi:hypothetical protein